MMPALLAVAVTLLAFMAARRLARAIGGPAWASPVLLAALGVSALLWLSAIPVPAYVAAAAPLTWWLKPAVVALGALLWDSRAELRARAVPLLTAVTIGLAVGVGSALGLARLAGLPPGLTGAFATRTVTTPFAVAIHAHGGGPVALAAAFAVLGGVVGTIVVPPLLRLLRITGPAATGTAIGVSAHLVGTDWLTRRSPQAAAFAGAAMVIAGVLATLALPFLLTLRP